LGRLDVEGEGFVDCLGVAACSGDVHGIATRSSWSISRVVLAPETFDNFRDSVLPPGLVIVATILAIFFACPANWVAILIVCSLALFELSVLLLW